MPAWRRLRREGEVRRGAAFVTESLAFVRSISSVYLIHAHASGQGDAIFTPHTQRGWPRDVRSATRPTRGRCTRRRGGRLVSTLMVYCYRSCRAAASPLHGLSSDSFVCRTHLTRMAGSFFRFTVPCTSLPRRPHACSYLFHGKVIQHTHHTGGSRSPSNLHATTAGASVRFRARP